jgi:hypothetical protein
MASVVEYVVSPPAPRDTRTLQELHSSLHKEIVELGPRGTLVLLGVLFSSTATFLARACSWLYRKARSYA